MERRSRYKHAYVPITIAALTISAFNLHKIAKTQPEYDSDEHHKPLGVNGTTEEYTVNPTIVLIGDKYRFNIDSLREQVEEADRTLDFSTDGAVRIGNPDIVHASSTLLADIEAKSNDCYTEEDTAAIVSNVRMERSLAESAYVMLVFDGKQTCNAARNPAYADMNGFESVYNQMDENTALRPLLHELGHNFGFKHAGTIGCTKLTATGDGFVRQSTSKAFLTIEEQLAAGCDVYRDQHGSVDAYDSNETVMGSMELGGFSVSAYLPTELHMIDPERFVIRRVSTTPARHELSLNEGGVLGVSVDLPESHPLHDIDPTIRSLTFALKNQELQNKRGKTAFGTKNDMDMLIIAEGEDMTYIVDRLYFAHLPRLSEMFTERQYKKAMRKEHMQYEFEPIAYMDRTLGLVVSYGENIDTKQPVVVFDTFENTEEKRAYFEETTEIILESGPVG